jgi:D-glycero-D-manno-heptose 1,7-bisphosphate phosphatase
MIQTAQTEFEIDMERSWMIGDKLIDIETGRLAGLRTALVLTGYGSVQRDLLTHAPNLITDDVGSAAAGIIDWPVK